MARRTASLLILVGALLSGVPVSAQDTASYEAPGHISFVDGSAVLERDGRIDSDLLSMPLLAGDRVRTENGRVEVLFPDGSALHLDSHTIVDFQSDEVVRLLEGRIRLSIAGTGRDVSYRVDAPSAWVQINDPGEYRIAILRNADVELAVLRGAAELVNEQGRSFIRAGERTFAREGAAPSPPYVFNSAAWDDFDRWSESRRDRRLGTSAQYLPGDVRPYAAAFDHYGDWRYEQSYGYVWYPRVHVGWRPYHRGRWVSLRPYGWTWIAGDPWGWPTHHYGRWGISAGAWFWIPGRHWGPAWVSWAYAPDYVSWCPLGWNNRPVLQIVNVNVFGGRRYSPWHAWTVIPRRHFSTGYVHVTRVANVRIDQRIHNTFVVQDRGPETRVAVGRAAPIRSVGRYAVPRGSVPGTHASETLAPRGPGSDRVATGRDRAAPADSRAGRTLSSPTGSSGERSEITRGAGNRAVSRERAAPDSSSPTSRAERSPVTRGGGDRAVARERAAPESSVTAPGGNPVESRGSGREYGRAPEARRSTGEANDATVTTAPPGAVRAVPRVRQSGDATSEPRGYSPERSRVREERAPVLTAPSAEGSTPRSSSSDPGVYRVNPGYRRAPETNEGPRGRIDSAAPRTDRGGPGYRPAPESGGDVRGRAVPRTDSPQPPPSYRAAPEQRRAPDGPPPGAGPSGGSRPSREPAAGGGPRPSRDSGAGPGSRQRSGDAQSSGQARRRQ